jgi:predicted DsbA family dithiol-disulfide isomerase
MTDTIRIDIWSDIACPWCYIGKHRFEEGIAQFARSHPDIEVEVEGHSYELAPDTPEDFAGSEIDFLSKHKGMAREQVEQMLSQMAQMAQLEGLEFNWDKLQHTNTGKLHRVLHLAKSQGVYSEMQERLFRAYFTDGAKVSDVETLAELGEEVGLDAEEVRDAFESEDLGEEVERDITRARMLGVSGVPFFLIDEKYGISGAQSAETFADALEQVLGLRQTEGQQDPV